ncbi:MAG: hypothetical protein M3445_03575 [Actinomycetota bacterium]|nr:hypothetical protein [Actinomycetota bacterium]
MAQDDAASMLIRFMSDRDVTFAEHQEFIDGAARLRPTPETATSSISDPMAQVAGAGCAARQRHHHRGGASGKKADLLDRI